MTTGQITDLHKIVSHKRREYKQKSEELRTAQVSDLCRKKLLNYADTFYDLAKSYDGKTYRDVLTAGGVDRQSLLAERRLWESRQIIKDHLGQMAKILTDVACEVMCYKPMEEKKKRILVKALQEEGIRVESPCYLPREDGRDTVVVTMSTGRRNSLSAEEASDMISVLLDRRLKLSVTSPCIIGHEPQSFVLEESASFLAITGFSRVTKENEVVSGDNYAVIEAEKGRVTLMLSDGTGSGEQASKDSGQVLDLMEKLLEAGYDMNAAINMVNAALYAMGEDQKHPTLDVCGLDLYKGSCELLKVGAAASFLKRKDKVETLFTGSLPLGVFQKVESQPVCRQLHDGDFLVMVTDGVVDAFGLEEYERGLVQAIETIENQNPGEVAEKLLRRAICASGGRIRDDMTVGVIGIWND